MERKWWRSGMAGVVGIALATVAVHLAVGWRYGFDRDELLALEDARHLAWGYVQYPPMTAFFGWVALKLFGTSLGGFRFFAAVVQAVALVLTGLMAKELARGAGKGKWKFEDEVPSGAEAPSGAGLNVAAEAAAHKAIGRDAALRKTAGQDEEGDAAREDGAVEILRVQRTHPQDDNGSRDAGERPEAERSQSFLVPGEPTRHSRWEPGEWAAVVATLAGVPFCLGAGALMQYISFDYVCWVVVAWGMVKLVTEEVASDEWRMASEEKSEDRNSKFEKRNSEGGGSLAVRAAHGKKPGVRGQESAEKEERFLASRTPRGMTGLRGGERGGGAFGEETGSGPPQKAVPTKAWWVVVGAGIGLGMLAKYTMGLLVAGVVVGVLATPLRRHLRNPWLWAGAVLSVAIFLPNFLWEWRHGFVSADFLRFLHERDVREGVTDGFLVGQLEVTMLAAPLAAAGLWFYFAGARHKEKEKTNAETQRAQRFAEEDPRADSAMYGVLGWMYVVPLVLLVALRGRDYYLAPAYPMLYAAGAVWAERKWGVGSGEWGETTKKRSNEVRKQGSNDEDGKRIENGQDAEVEILRPHTTRPQDDNAFLGRWVRRVVWVTLIVDVMVAGAVALPIAPVNSRWWKVAAKIDPVFPEEIGWEEFTQSVAEVWGRLPEAERAHGAILAGNYGEVGALNLYGERFGLPRAASGVNSSWERGYGERVPETLVVVGYPRELLEKYFASCEVGGRVWNKYGVANEETVEDPEIFVCRGLKGNWEEFWRAVQKFA